MQRQPREAERDGMKEWFERECSKDGFEALAVSNGRTKLRLPRQADNVGELISRACDELGAICDLTVDEKGRSELTFWPVPKEDGAHGLTSCKLITAAKIFAALAFFLFLVASVDYLLTPSPL